MPRRTRGGGLGVGGGTLSSSFQALIVWGKQVTSNWHLHWIRFHFELWLLALGIRSQGISHTLSYFQFCTARCWLPSLSVCWPLQHIQQFLWTVLVYFQILEHVALCCVSCMASPRQGLMLWRNIRWSDESRLTAKSSALSSLPKVCQPHLTSQSFAVSSILKLCWQCPAVESSAVQLHSTLFMKTGHE